MAIQQKENHTYTTHLHFVQKAESLKKQLITEIAKPVSIVSVKADPHAVFGWSATKSAEISQLPELSFGKGQSVTIDFGTHLVGYPTLNIRPVGSPPDAPLHLRLTFGEMPFETEENFSTYDGWVSSSWLQQEQIHIDELPHVLELNRRYSFRYLKIEVLDTSKKFTVAFDDVSCKTVTSADIQQVAPLHTQDLQLQTLDRISIKTLQDCMQDIFEDGPKRDRRLWLGDLRLQALANYETFQNYDLVKRCLYLFAAVPDDNGLVSSNLFIKPNLIPDDTYLLDYALFFAVTLHDYFMATNDHETAHELWPVAYRQIELALTRVNSQHLLEDDSTGAWWCFIDWHPTLNKQAAMHAIMIYSMKRAATLARAIGQNVQADVLEKKISAMKKAAIQYLWDESKQQFTSGSERQISWASQIWMVLAEVFDTDKSHKIMATLIEQKPEIAPVTPYMYHHLIDALISVNDMTAAIKFMESYWGEMVADGADTFWEAYDPNNKGFSPYGNNLINSFCHAWSCTPTYFIRKYKMG